MKSKRAISINNSIVHGICNYNCITCGVNKNTYNGPKYKQKLITFEKLLRRIEEAADEGIYVRYLTLSGDGEPTLHEDLIDICTKVNFMLENWRNKPVLPPSVSIITNGSRLSETNVLEAISDKNLFLHISFPTSVPEHYYEIMFGDASQPIVKFDLIINNILLAMKLYKDKRIESLIFHISPPVAKYIRRDIEETIIFLVKLSKKQGIDHLNLTIFPSVSNRTGLVGAKQSRIDSYKDIYKKYQGRKIDGVTIHLESTLKRFYRNLGEIVDLMKSFNHPCLWYGNFFFTPSGDSICCNDQAVAEKNGNFMTHSLKELMKIKENNTPEIICNRCNQNPRNLSGNFFIWLYRTFFNFKKNL